MMDIQESRVDLARVRSVFMVGIKGTGMCALAELLVKRGIAVSGSDTADVFYTDAILEALAITVKLFSAGNIDQNCELVIHSAAYSPETNPELAKAKALSLPVLSYPQALGAFSRLQPSFGISGVHGKTTTTAIAGTLAAALGLPATILAASAVKSFGDRSTLVNGDELFIAETCEYRRHFLNFRPEAIIVTSIEPDHQDYFPDYQSIFQAFMDYALSLPDNGALIYCADDKGSSDLARELSVRRGDIKSIPYGFTAEGDFRILPGPAPGSFTLGAFPDQQFQLNIPGRHIMADSVAALALCSEILERHGGISRERQNVRAMIQGIGDFRGSKRRYELLGEAGGVMFMDDYAHHPTAIKATLAGLRERYPGRRLVVDFMAHTYSRTEALYEEFASAFADADLLVIHDIYPSAREKPAEHWKISGPLFFSGVQAHNPNARYFSGVMDAEEWLSEQLRRDDIFITLGAGDNWQLSHRLCALYQEKYPL